MRDIRHTIASVVYKTTWPLWYLLFKFFLRLKVQGAKKEVRRIKEGPILIAANHVAWFDPFLVGCSLPNKKLIFPIRWLTKDKFFHIPIIGQTVWLYGSLKLEKGIGIDKTLAEAIEILRNDGVVGIFPEGKVRKSGRPRKGRRGIAYLAMHTDPLIIPVYISGAYQITFMDIILRRKKIIARIGRPERLPEKFMHNPKQIDRAAEYLMGRIRELR